MRRTLWVGGAGAALVAAIILEVSLKQEVQTKKPEQLATDPALQGAVSYIGLPITLRVEDVQTLLRQQFPREELYVVSGQRVNNSTTLQVVLKKRGEPTVVVDGDALKVQVPVRAELRVDWEASTVIKFVIGSKRISVKHHEDGSSDFTVFARLKPRLKEDYAFDPGLDLSYTLDRAAEFRIGPIEVNFVSKVREALDGQMGKFERTVKAMMANVVDVKRHAAAGWKALETPRLLDKDLKLWAWCEPVSFHCGAPKMTGDAVVLGTGLSARIFAAAQVTEPTVKTRPLAGRVQDAAEEGLHVNIPVRIAYERIEDLLRRNVKGTTLDIQGNSARFEDFSVYGCDGGGLVVGARVTLKAAGSWRAERAWVYLIGQPSFSPETSVLSVKKLAFDLDTQDVLLKAASWFVAPVVTKLLEEKLVYDAGVEVAAVVKDANRYVGNLELADGVSLQLDVRKAQIGGIFIGKDGMTCMIEADGRARMSVNLARAVRPH